MLFASLYLASLSLVYKTPGPSAQDPQEHVPWEASVDSYAFIEPNISPHAIYVFITPRTDSGEVFAFPSFALRALTLLDESHIEKGPLLGKDEAIQDPWRTAAPPSGVYLHVELLDIERSPRHYQTIARDVAKASGIDPAKIRRPSIQPNSWWIELVVDDDIRGEAQTIASRRISRKLDEIISVDLYLDRTQWALLRQSKSAQRITLKVRCDYEANTKTSTVSAEASQIISNSSQLRQLQGSTPTGEPAALLVPLGGAVEQTSSLRQEASRALNISVTVSEGATLSLGEQLLDKVFALLTSEFDLSKEDRSSVVTFLLGDGVSLTSSLSSLQEVVQRTKEEDIDKLLTDTTDSGKLNISGKAEAKWAEFGGSAEATYSKEQLAKRLRDALTERRSELERIAKGELSFANGIRFGKNGSVQGFQETFAKIDFSQVSHATKRLSFMLSPRAAVSTENFVTVPVGSVIPFVGRSIPSGWQLCDGSPIKDAASPLLLLGFSNVPDLRGRFLVGSGSTDPSLISAPLNSVGGSVQLPAHHHNAGYSSQARVLDSYRYSRTNTGPGGGNFVIDTDANELSGSQHDHYVGDTTEDEPRLECRPPYYSVAFIIRTSPDRSPPGC